MKTSCQSSHWNIISNTFSGNGLISSSLNIPLPEPVLPKWLSQRVSNTVHVLNLLWNMGPVQCWCSVSLPSHNELTHWRWDKMATVSQTTFSNAFYWMKTWISINISLKLVSKGHQQYSSIGSNNGLAPTRQQAIICTHADTFYWQINASLGLNQLIHTSWLGRWLSPVAELPSSL